MNEPVICNSPNLHNFRVKNFMDNEDDTKPWSHSVDLFRGLVVGKARLRISEVRSFKSYSNYKRLSN